MIICNERLDEKGIERNVKKIKDDQQKA